MRNAIRFFVLLIAIGAIAACGVDSESSESDSSTNPGSSTFQSDAGNFSVRFDEETLPPDLEPEDISISAASSSEMESGGNPDALASFTLGPSGRKFDPPLRVIVELSGDVIERGESLRFQLIDAGADPNAEPEYLSASEIDFNEQTESASLTFEVPHFSEFVISRGTLNAVLLGPSKMTVGLPEEIGADFRVNPDQRRQTVTNADGSQENQLRQVIGDWSLFGSFKHINLNPERTAPTNTDVRLGEVATRSMTVTCVRRGRASAGWHGNVFMAEAQEPVDANDPSSVSKGVVDVEEVVVLSWGIQCEVDEARQTAFAEQGRELPPFDEQDKPLIDLFFGLGLTLRGQDGRLHVGDSVIFTFIVENEGLQAAENVTLSSSVGATENGIVFLALDPSKPPRAVAPADLSDAPTITERGTRVEKIDHFIGTLKPGEQANVRVFLDISTDFADSGSRSGFRTTPSQGEVINVEVAISGSNFATVENSRDIEVLPVVDPDPTVVPAPTPVLTETGLITAARTSRLVDLNDNGFANVGEPVDFTVTLESKADGTLRDVMFVERTGFILTSRDAYFTFNQDVEPRTTQGSIRSAIYSPATDEINVRIGDLPPGQPVTITFRLTIASESATGPPHGTELRTNGWVNGSNFNRVLLEPWTILVSP